MIVNKKYDLIDTPIINEGVTVYRIQATRSFSDVKEGDIGGYVESMYNLSHSGDCWIYNEAVVKRGAYVEDNAKICDHAIITTDSHISDNAIVSGYARVRASLICNDAHVYGDTHIKESRIIENGRVYGYAHIVNSSVSDYARVFGDAKVLGDSTIEHYASVYNKASVIGGYICGNALIHGNVYINKAMHIGGFADISNNLQVLSIGHIQTAPDESAMLTFYTDIDAECILVSEFRKVYKLDEFEQLVNERYKDGFGDTEYGITLKNHISAMFEYVRKAIKLKEKK